MAEADERGSDNRGSFRESDEIAAATERGLPMRGERMAGVYRGGVYRG